MAAIAKALSAAAAEKDGGPQALFELLAKHNSRDGNYSFVEAFELMPPKDQEKLWKHVSSNLHVRFAAAFSETGDEEDDDEEDVLVDYVEAVCTLGLSALSTATPAWSEPFLAAVTLLHDSLFLLNDGFEGLQDAIARLCELCWKLEVAGREALVPNTVSLLLIRSLASRSPAAVVKRVYAMRGALQLLDLDGDAATDLQAYLLRCVAHPTYTRADEGRRFLSFLFGLTPRLVDAVHRAIKAALPAASRAACAAYGEVIFRAWKNAPPALQARIETGVVQDLMYHAVHAAKGPRGTGVGPALRRVLGHLHAQKKHRGVDAMLARLYEPILWRALKVASPAVRANAAALFFDAFPLMNADAPRAEADRAIQQQFDAAADLLTDDDPGVRAIAVLGVCRLLNTYWEMVPMATTTALLEIIANDLAWDVNAGGVRAAVCEGLAGLLDNALAAPVLAALLPHLAPMLHDTSERVRCAFVDLLLRVKDMRAIKFWKIVPLTELVARLDVDTPAVGRRLTALLLRSFLPHDKPAHTLADRCEALVAMNPRAARRFYVHGRTHVPADGLAALAHALLARATDNPRLLDIVAICMAGPGPAARPGDRDAAAHVHAAAAEMLPRLLVQCATDSDPHATYALVRIASHLDAQATSALAAQWLAALGAESSPRIQAVEAAQIECLVLWGHGAALVRLIASALGAEGKEGGGKARKRPRTTDRIGLPAGNLPAPSAARGLALLAAILDHPRRRGAVLEGDWDGDGDALGTLLAALSDAPARVADCLARKNKSGDTDAAALALARLRLQAFGRLAVAAHLRRRDGRQLGRLAELAGGVLAAACKQGDGNGDGFPAECMDIALGALAEPLSVSAGDDEVARGVSRVIDAWCAGTRAAARACYQLHTHGHGAGRVEAMVGAVEDPETARAYAAALVRHAQQHGDTVGDMASRLAAALKIAPASDARAAITDVLRQGHAPVQVQAQAGDGDENVDPEVQQAVMA